MEYTIYSYYFQALQGLGSSDRRHFYFIFMAQQQTIFNYSHAAVIGVEEYVLALFLKDNFGIDAHCQKPLSVAKMAAEINFFTAKQIKRILKSLEDGGWITAEKINAKLYDQSKAYKFTEKFYQLTTPF